MRIAQLSLAISAVAPHWLQRPLMSVYDQRLSWLIVGLQKNPIGKTDFSIGLPSQSIETFATRRMEVSKYPS
jgi:hypothetical protein